MMAGMFGGMKLQAILNYDDPCRYEYQMALPSQLERLKGMGWEIIPQANGDPLGAYGGHHVGFEPALYVRRLIEEKGQ